MYLKESFQYQNYLDGLIQQTEFYLQRKEFVMNTVEYHKKGKANANAKDEDIEVLDEDLPKCSPNRMIDFLVFLMEEKEILSYAISKAKEKSAVDIDVSIQNNNLRRRVGNTIASLGRKKSSENKSFGVDYMINAEGNQVPYKYEITEVSTIDFDRNKVKAIAKKIFEKSDAVSIKIDKALTSIEVKYDAPFDIHDMYEDSLQKYLDRQGVDEFIKEFIEDSCDTEKSQHK